MSFTFRLRGAICLKSSDGVVEIEMPKVNTATIDHAIQEQHIREFMSQGLSASVARRIADAGACAMYQESVVQILRDAILE